MSIYILELPSVLFSCPKYWQNFVNNRSEEIRKCRDNTVLNQELAKYHGYYRDFIVRFETEEDFVVFKLRWS